jgi:hypothetical protein
MIGQARPPPGGKTGAGYCEKIVLNQKLGSDGARNAPPSIGKPTLAALCGWRDHVKKVTGELP